MISNIKTCEYMQGSLYSPLQHDLQEAIDKGDYTSLEILSLCGFGVIDFNERLSNGLTPLNFAIEKQNLRMVEYLIKNGASINKSDQDQLSPLYTALRKNHMSIVRLLLERDASLELNIESVDQISLVLEASRSKQYEIVEILIDKGGMQLLKSKIGELTIFAHLIKLARNNLHLSCLLLRKISLLIIDSEKSSFCKTFFRIAIKSEYSEPHLIMLLAKMPNKIIDERIIEYVVDRKMNSHATQNWIIKEQEANEKQIKRIIGGCSDFYTELLKKAVTNKVVTEKILITTIRKHFPNQTIMTLLKYANKDQIKGENILQAAYIENYNESLLQLLRSYFNC